MVANEVMVAPQAEEKEALNFEALFQRYQTHIYNYVLRVIGNHEEAQDLTQETFLKVYQSLDKAGGVSNLRAWIYRIATNTCIDSLRRRRVIGWVPWDRFAQTFPLERRDGPEGAALRKERSEMVLDVLRRLQHQHRVSLLLHEHEGLSCQEVGHVLGKSPTAVKSILFRAREEFRKIYTQLYGCPE